MNLLEKIISAIELHSVTGIRACFEDGLEPNVLWRGEPLIYELTSEYSRGPRFKTCVKTFIEYGLIFEDKPLLAVLSDDANALAGHLAIDPELINKKYSLRCAYTPLYQVTLLHICAEFNHVSCAEMLVANGADINAPAGRDEYGFGGQTPIFHTVNQNQHQSKEMLDFLLKNGADLQLTVPGLIWGKNYEWETLIPAINPVSYALMGLLPQMHRDEITTFQIISKLLKHAWNIDYIPANVPNAYLNS